MSKVMVDYDEQLWNNRAHKSARELYRFYQKKTTSLKEEMITAAMAGKVKHNLKLRYHPALNSHLHAMMMGLINADHNHVQESLYSFVSAALQVFLNLQHVESPRPARSIVHPNSAGISGHESNSLIGGGLFSYLGLGAFLGKGLEWGGFALEVVSLKVSEQFKPVAPTVVEDKPKPKPKRDYHQYLYALWYGELYQWLKSTFLCFGLIHGFQSQQQLALKVLKAFQKQFLPRKISKRISHNELLAMSENVGGVARHLRLIESAEGLRFFCQREFAKTFIPFSPVSVAKQVYYQVTRAADFNPGASNLVTRKFKRTFLPDESCSADSWKVESPPSADEFLSQLDKTRQFIRWASRAEVPARQFRRRRRVYSSSQPRGADRQYIRGNVRCLQSKFPLDAILEKQRMVIPDRSRPCGLSLSKFDIDTYACTVDDYLDILPRSLVKGFVNSINAYLVTVKWDPRKSHGRSRALQLKTALGNAQTVSDVGDILVNFLKDGTLEENDDCPSKLLRSQLASYVLNTIDNAEREQDKVAYDFLNNIVSESREYFLLLSIEPLLAKIQLVVKDYIERCRHDPNKYIEVARARQFAFELDSAYESNSNQIQTDVGAHRMPKWNKISRLIHDYIKADGVVKENNSSSNKNSSIISPTLAISVANTIVSFESKLCTKSSARAALWRNACQQIAVGQSLLGTDEQKALPQQGAFDMPVSTSHTGNALYTEINVLLSDQQKASDQLKPVKSKVIGAINAYIDANKDCVPKWHGLARAQILRQRLQRATNASDYTNELVSFLKTGRVSGVDVWQHAFWGSWKRTLRRPSKILRGDISRCIFGLCPDLNKGDAAHVESKHSSRNVNSSILDSCYLKVMLDAADASLEDRSDVSRQAVISSI